VEPGLESNGEAPVWSRCSLLRNPWPNTTDVLEHCHEGMSVLRFFGEFPCVRIPKAMKDINVKLKDRNLPQRQFL
jgi:hypothetical protein